MLYLDTSLLVTFLTRERRTDEVARWLADMDLAALTISNWVVAEFSAALSRKLRDGRMTANERARSLGRFNDLAAHSLVRLPVEDRHFVAAAQLSDREKTGLRAGDALHLAIAAENGAKLCTLDKGLAKAGAELGLATELV